MPVLTDRALALARRGLPVFPCAASKQPCIARHEGGRGFHDATTEPHEVIRLFAHSAARLIGVPTGARSGIDVLDIDPRHGGHLWEAENRARLPETRIHATRSGGRHRLLTHANGVVNSEGRIAPGVDVRGAGGYVIWWPAHGCTVLSDAPVAAWPPWLLVPGQALADAKPRPVSSSVGCLAASAATATERAVRAFVARTLDTVRRAPDGQKHHILRAAARLLGGVAHCGGFSDEAAAEWLLAALPASVRDWENARRTALWALARGREAPVEPPEAPVTAEEARAIARVAYRALALGHTPADMWPDVRAFADQLGVGPHGARNILEHCNRTREAP